MLTYAEARALLDAKTRNIADGVALPHKRKCRIFWRETPAKGERGKGDIEVYVFNRWTRGKSIQEKRTLGDDGSYGSGKICRIRPNGNYEVFVTQLTWDQRGINVLPDEVEWSSRVLTPLAGPPPKFAKVPKVDLPFWLPEKFDAIIVWDERADEANHAKGRAIYEANIKRYGSLERWYAAYHRMRQTENRNRAKEEEWRGDVIRSYMHGKRRYRHVERRDDKRTCPLFVGAVVTPMGQLTQASWAAERKRTRAERLAAEKAERERLAAVKKAEAEFTKGLGSRDAKKIFESLDESVRTYLRQHKLVPNADGTVRMVKITRPDGSSFNGSPPVKYEVGTTVRDPNYQPNLPAWAGCGGGLHFCPTREQCSRYFGFHRGGRPDADAKSFVVNVDLKTMRVADTDKVVAEWCYVVCEGDETTVLPSAGEQKARRKMTEADKARIARTKVEDREAIAEVRAKREAEVDPSEPGVPGNDDDRYDESDTLSGPVHESDTAKIDIAAQRSWRPDQA